MVPLDDRSVTGGRDPRNVQQVLIENVLTKAQEAITDNHTTFHADFAQVSLCKNLPESFSVERRPAAVCREVDLLLFE